MPRPPCGCHWPTLLGFACLSESSCRGNISLTGSLFPSRPSPLAGPDPRVFSPRPTPERCSLSVSSSLRLSLPFRVLPEPTRRLPSRCLHQSFQRLPLLRSFSLQRFSCGEPTAAGLPHPLRSALRLSHLSAASFSPPAPAFFHAGPRSWDSPSRAFPSCGSRSPFRTALPSCRRSRRLPSVSGSTKFSARTSRLQGLAPPPKYATPARGATSSQGPLLSWGSSPSRALSFLASASASRNLPFRNFQRRLPRIPGAFPPLPGFAPRESRLLVLADPPALLGFFPRPALADSD